MYRSCGGEEPVLACENHDTSIILTAERKTEVVEIYYAEDANIENPASKSQPGKAGKTLITSNQHKKIRTQLCPLSPKAYMPRHPACGNRISCYESWQPWFRSASQPGTRPVL